MKKAGNQSRLFFWYLSYDYRTISNRISDIILYYKELATE